MFRLFRRPPRQSFELDPEEAAPSVGAEALGPDAEGARGPSTGRGRRLLKPILAFGILAVGLGVLYLSWNGGRSVEPAPPRLLPQGRAPLAEEPPGPLQGAPPAPLQPAQAPTFHQPLQRDPREAAQVAAGQESGVPAGGPYSVLAQASHEATVENLRSQIAELKLKKLKAELEADELRRNPKRLFKDERPPAEPKNEAKALERLARVPPPVLPIPGPVPIPAQLQAPAQPVQSPAPPQMRVRMVTLAPKEALIEAGDGDSRGWFKVQEGQKFPDFVVTRIGADGVTISFAGRGFFYPVGGSALGAPPQDSRPAGSRQGSEPPRH